MNYTKGEKLLRCKVAATYRLVDIMAWNEGLNAHITVSIHYMFLFKKCFLDTGHSRTNATRV